MRLIVGLCRPVDLGDAAWRAASIIIGVAAV